MDNKRKSFEKNLNLKFIKRIETILKSTKTEIEQTLDHVSFINL